MPYLWLIIGFIGLILSIFGLYHPNLQQFDQNAVKWLSLHRFTGMNELAVFSSHIGGLPSVLLICGLWSLQQYKSKKNAYILLIFLGLLGSSAIAWLLKFWFNRPRPELALQMVETYGASFPSAHSIYAATLSCLIMLIYHKHAQAKKIIFLACFWFIFMGTCRIYLAAHYPSDVLAGWSIAFIWIGLLWLAFKQFCNDKQNYF